MHQLLQPNQKRLYRHGGQTAYETKRYFTG